MEWSRASWSPFTLFLHPHSKRYAIEGLDSLLELQDVEAPRISIQSAH